MGKKKEKAEKKKSGRKRPPVETALYFRAVERSEAKAAAEGSVSPSRSLTGTSMISPMRSSVSASGADWPLSHFDTV